ncbi:MULTISPECIES: helix-turn-helix transcriptional regulator [Brevundimonas]|uniref:AraC family transcriptional regulator n=2 Tax=Brevundimonas TaxID=41275 RepID=A0A4Y9RWN6_9CAUL|nr:MULTISPECIES: AraC family transcriptional regulator [Brevundimonas]TFW13494.1 AraC family transcriptional regulator [Brevundimonas intermedia]VDC51044.1 hypothetical protein BREV_BREV_02473 [Brevundimonas mediterranea]
MSPDGAWRGGLQIGPGWARWRGAVGDNALHRHLAAQAVFADRPIAVGTAGGRVLRATAFLVDPLVGHRLGAAAQAEILFFEPGSLGVEARAALRAVLVRASSAHVLAAEGRRRFWSDQAGGAGGEPAAPAVSWMAGVLTFIDAALSEGPVRLDAAAGRAGLSADRFRHVFAEAQGLSFKRFVLWRRLQLAATLLAGGVDVTTAAHEAGFSDGAHLARTMKAMFGVQPRRLVPSG